MLHYKVECDSKHMLKTPKLEVYRENVHYDKQPAAEKEGCYRELIAVRG
jgi:hypothetical protein